MQLACGESETGVEMVLSIVVVVTSLSTELIIDVAVAVSTKNVDEVSVVVAVGPS